MSSNSGREEFGGSDKTHRTQDTPSTSKKRLSGHGTSGEDHPTSSKVRKLARGAAQACPASSSQQQPEVSNKKSLELRFLTDFYPDQDQSRPLTRSRTKNADSKEQKPSTSKGQKATTRRSRSKKVKPESPAKDQSPILDDQQLSNLTVPESEVSGFSVSSTLTSDTSKTIISTSEVRETGNSNDTTFVVERASGSTVIMSALPPTDSDVGDEGEMFSGSSRTLPTGTASTSREEDFQQANTTQLLNARSQHAQRASAFLGSLVPRMQHLLGGAIGGANSSLSTGFSQSFNGEFLPQVRINSLLDELRCDNEIRQSEACSEISETLLLGNEESLPNFPIRELILALINILNKESNFDLMLSACRCISNLQEALPRSHPCLIEAIPVLLQKLKRIEYIDVAEQALVILEVISRRSARNILTSNGVQAVISHVDFFSLPTQRLAFQIAANCAAFVAATEFHLVQDCLADLTQRLHSDDKRCVESICTFFNRLVENIRNSPKRLRITAGKNFELLQVFQQLLAMQPSLLSSNTFINIVKSLRFFCNKCGDLAVALLQMDISKTLCFLLVGSDKKGVRSSDIITRPSQHIREIVDLCGELVPILPNDGIFEINNFMEQYVNPAQFRPKNNAFRSLDFSSFAAGQHEDLQSFSLAEQMLERNRALASITESEENTPDQRDELKTARLDFLLDHITAIFPLLVDIGSNSTCSSLRYECMRVMLRMVQSVEGREQLLSFLQDVPLAAYVSNTFSSSKNLALVALAIQITHVLLKKMPDLYRPLFETEGVFFELSNKTIIPPQKKATAVIDEPQPTTSTGNTPQEIPAVSSTSASHAAVLGRLLAAQNQHQHLGLPGAVSGLPPFPVSVPYDPSQIHPSALSTAANTRYSTDPSVINVRNVYSQQLLNGLTGQTASLYQSLHNAVNYSVYGLNYASLSNTLEYSNSSFTSTNSQVTSSPTTSSVKNTAAQKLECFIGAESLKICGEFEESVNGTKDDNRAALAVIANRLLTPKENGLEALRDLAKIVNNHKLSSFHINHSGIIPALTFYLTDNTKTIGSTRHNRLKEFISTFLLMSNEAQRPLGGDEHFPAFRKLVSNIILAVERLEQFNVRVTNLSGNVPNVSGSSYTNSSSANNITSSSAYLRGAQALKFFQSHQIRCNLRRHQSCTVLREWRKGRGSIKVDPFTSISAIEKYLVDRGIGTSNQDEESSENDDDAGSYSNSNPVSSNYKGKIEILIGDNRLPSEMSILQAIRQFSISQDDEDQDAIPSSIWLAGHTLLYRAINTEQPSTSVATGEPSTSSAHDSSAGPPSKIFKVQKQIAKKTKDKKHKEEKKDKTLFSDGKVPQRVKPLDRYLNGTLNYKVEDPCASGLVLLKALYALNNYWWCLYNDSNSPPSSHAPILTAGCFISQKLNSKVNRQLSDFLTVATQQIPSWTKHIVKSVPFAFSFVTRRNFLYCTAFGRDRALMHIVNEANPDDHDTESNSRLVPRLERKKVSINRSSLLKDAQQAIAQLSTSKPLLEVGFDGEVGTGFGPTLEFYSTLSRELQKSSLKLWHGTTTTNEVEGVVEEYVVGETGLFPVISKNASTSKNWDSRPKRFEFIGRLMAQTLLDSRILDLPLATPLFSWILGEQDSLGLADFEDLEPTIFNSMRQLGKLDDDSLSSMEMMFTFPGNDNFELLKGGKNKALSSSNYRQFVDLVCHWRLVEGVRHDMEALRKGFQQVVNVDHLRIFEPREMESLFCGNSEKDVDGIWSKNALQHAIRPDHGYTHDSQPIVWLIEMLSSYDKEQRRKFLQFVTGSPRLPVGGFRALHPPLTVVRKSASYGNTDQELPSAMTCYNYLKIPPYESLETFKERFNIALQYIYSFHLT